MKMRNFSSSSSSSSPMAMIVSTLVMLTLLMGNSSAHKHALSTDFYETSCPDVFSTVYSVVKAAVRKEKRMGASLLRLHFHDCFVQGCDGSILLDSTSSSMSEKFAVPNNNSVRGYEVINEIKSKVEALCPGVVSCADIVTIAARDSVVLLGGPDWEVKVGRRDSKLSYFSAAGDALPPATANISLLVEKFKRVGLSTTDLVALSGGHTIGKARCIIFRDRIYDDTINIDASFAKRRQQTCPKTTGKGDNNWAPLDFRSQNDFDNRYFKNLINKKGLLRSDQTLYDSGSTRSLVEKYSSHPRAFDRDFVAAMIRMGDFRPLTGSKGEIRKNCRKRN